MSQEAEPLATESGKSGNWIAPPAPGSSVPTDPELWRRLLWIRDQAANGRQGVVVGESASIAAVLLARTGMTVDAVDTGQIRVPVDTDEARDVFDKITITPANSQSLRDLFARSGIDTAVLHGAPIDEFQAALAALAAAPSMERLIVALPFGQPLSYQGAAIFPRVLMTWLASFGACDLDVVDGWIRAVCRRSGPASAPTDAWLLEKMERGASRLAHRSFQLEAEYEELRSRCDIAEGRVRELEGSLSFRLGTSLVGVVRSPSELFRLPSKVFALWKERKHRSVADVSAGGERRGMTEWEKESLRNHVGKSMAGGAAVLKREIAEFLPGMPATQLAFAYLIAAQECGRLGDRDLEFEMARAALEMNHSIGMVRGFLHVALRTRRMEAAGEALREIHASAARGNSIAIEFLEGFRQTSSYKIAVLEGIPPRAPSPNPDTDGRLVYVLHNSLPYSSGGYATRSHGVACGLAANGRDVVCLTRPGYPLDIKPDLAPIDMPIVDRIDGIRYQRVTEPTRRNLMEYEYVTRSMDSMEAEIRRLRPAFVQAASNYVTALPALVAARRLGVPFFYEVRGLWEITRMSRDDKFAESISFDVQRYIEATVAREADHVFTLTEPMREELIVRGVNPERITLLPNSVDAERFRAREREQALADDLGIPPGVPVIGYIGTFVVYEGLEDLTAACVKLHRRGVDFRLLMVGNENASGQERGPITEDVLRIAQQGGISSKLIMTGRVPHEQVESYYSLLDICPFPRKPWPVCEMVSPMKPLEALAMEKAVVVSSVRALAEMIQHDVTGVVFEKGNVDSLAEAIADLIAAPAKRRQLGQAGRDWVSRERSWVQIARRMEAVLAQFESQGSNGREANPAPGKNASATQIQGGTDSAGHA
jgi:glycosyltransferase involved in cell wall biosynthesis